MGCFPVHTQSSRLRPITVLLIATGIVFGAPLTAHAQGGVLSLNPANAGVQAGDTFDVQMTVDTADQRINAIEAEVRFPPRSLRVLSVSKNGSILTLWPDQPSYDNAAGTLRFGGGLPHPGFQGSGRVLSIRFQALATDEAVMIRLTSGAILADDGTGTNILSTLRTSTVRIEPKIIAPEPLEGEPRREAPPEERTSPPEEERTSPPEVTPPTGGPPAPPSATELVEPTSTIPTTGAPVPLEPPLPTPPAPVVAAPGIPQRLEKRVRRAAVALQKTKTYRVLDQRILNNPVVEEVNVKVATPVVITTVVANFGIAIRIESLFSYLQWLITQPLLYIARRRHRSWGVVYSSLTKLPIDLAIVRLFNPTTGKLVRTRVTDQGGRYLLLADPGTYKIGVTKPEFTFPSTLLHGNAEDSVYTDLYHGEPIQVVNAQTAIIRPIPIDPIEKTETPGEVRRKVRKRTIQRAIAYISPALSVTSLAISPTPTSAALFGAQIVMLIAFRRLAVGRTPRSWGLVRDANTSAPIPFAVVRMFDQQFNKLLETQVTDRSGRYAFLVGRGMFYLTAEKSGYQPFHSDFINLSKEKELNTVKQEMTLHPLHSKDA